MTGVLRRELPQNELLRRVGGHMLPATVAEAFSAGVGMETTGSLLERQTDIRQLDTGDFQGVPSEAGEFGGQGPLLAERDDKLAPEVLNERYRDLGLTFERPMTEAAAKLIAEAKRAEIIRQDVASRAPGVSGFAATLAGSLVATAIDPLEVASAFVPVVSQARAAGLIARLGAVRGRAAVGAIEGAVGNALFEPVFGTLSVQQQLDYGMADALLNVGLGGAIGGLAGTALGVAARRIELDRTRPPFDATVPSDVRPVQPPEIVRRMENETAIAAHRAAIAQVAEGRAVDVSPYVSARGEPSGVARHAPGGAKRPQTLVEFIAQNGGINDADPTFRGEIQARGNPNVPFAGKLARKSSKRNLDNFAEVAHEEGFISKRDVGELLDAIDRELRGEPVVRLHEMAEAMDRAEGKRAVSEADRLRDEFDETLAELRALGISDTTPEEIERIALIKRRDQIGTEEAFERLAIESADDVAAREMDPRRDAAADFEASAAVEREIADEFDLEADNKELLAIIDQMRQDGRLSEAVDESTAEADALAAKARTYGNTARAVAACLAG